MKILKNKKEKVDDDGNFENRLTCPGLECRRVCIRPGRHGVLGCTIEECLGEAGGKTKWPTVACRKWTQVEVDGET